MNTPKWIPKHSVDVLKIFEQARQVERDIRMLGKKFVTDINLDLPDYYEFEQLVTQSKQCFELSESLQMSLMKLASNSTNNKRIDRSSYKVLQSKKSTLIRQNLKRKHFQLIFVINKIIKIMLGTIQHTDVIIDAALVLCTLHNVSVESTKQNTKSVSGAQVCSNSFPTLLLPPKTIDIGMILQIISKYRSEQCCLSLISCLLTTSKPTDQQQQNSNSTIDSDTSSIVILKTLTTHLSSPLDNTTINKFNSLNINNNNNNNNQLNCNYNRTMTINNNGSIRNPGTGSNGVVGGGGGGGCDPTNNNNTTSELEVKIEKPLMLSDSESNDPTIRFFDRMANEYNQNNNNNGNNRNNYKQHYSYSLLLDNDDERIMGNKMNCNDLFGIDLLDSLISDEENYIANILLRCLRLCPSVFDKKPNKMEIIKWVTRGTRNLWTQVGSTLEHVVLWWSHSPLACRPVACTKYLRNWLLNIQPEDAPEPILSTLRGLGETLTVHVAGTTWDKQFRLTLVSSILPIDNDYCNTEFYCELNQQNGTTTGRLWSDLLGNLIAICNSCDRNGTIPNELPIVEQIPVLHRLDHSVHTMRLWAADKAKTLCTDWNMKMYFKVVQNDVNACLEKLQELRVPELVPADALEVLIQVCVALRAKLVSEIKININKLKSTYGECIDVLASICRTISLATLSLCFPMARLWQIDIVQTKSQDYVMYYLNQLYLPVLEATTNLEILSLILKIMCESWLDHIYMKRIKFSRSGALNLLKDFDGVSIWITNCTVIQPQHIELLAKHEVLRMCEGVGKILLRKPEEVISMVPSKNYYKLDADGNEEKAPLPPEMFVPNQQRWLELRARNRQPMNCLCICTSNVQSIDSSY